MFETYKIETTVLAGTQHGICLQQGQSSALQKARRKAWEVGAYNQCERRFPQGTPEYVFLLPPEIAFALRPYFATILEINRISAGNNSECPIQRRDCLPDIVKKSLRKCSRSLQSNRRTETSLHLARSGRLHEDTDSHFFISVHAISSERDYCKLPPQLDPFPAVQPKQ